LIQTHPFGQIHGGSLHAPEWQASYEALLAQLEKVDAHELEEAKRQTGMGDEDAEQDGEEKKPEVEENAEQEEEGDESAPKERTKKKPRQSQLDISALQAEQSNLDPNFVLQLRLAKKYYSDALRFINSIESAVPILAQLLVSTNKSEALEAIRFFRIAYEYKLVGAEVGIKTMIHLIWTKDNTSTGAPSEVVEAEKGIRGSLIETYKSLYFDVVPDLNPRQQVNRIAKNMIERTYDATLAELTSLEELMRTMMMEGGAEGGVHEDVINKLWQVYCE
jgi:condensin complex subunit 1